MPNLISELKKRKVFSSSAIYLGTAFIILQVASIIIPALLIPDWVLRLLVVLAILGFPIVVVLSWIYDISDSGFVKTESEKTETVEETQTAGMSKSSMVGILATIIITIFMIYNGVEYVTTSKQGGNKTSIAVLNFDNVRKSKEYKVKQIANNIDVDFILHGQFTIFDMDSTIKILAFFADTKTFASEPLMNEKYPQNELSDIPIYINEKVSEYIKTNSLFHPIIK